MRSLFSVASRPLALALVLLPVLPLAAQGAADDATKVVAYIDGESVVGGGDADGFADFAAKIDTKAGQICYSLVVEGTVMTAAHIHEGKEGKNGAPVVTLEATVEDGDDVCATIDPKLAKAIAAKPANYYVNVHSEAFLAGAVRGQMEDQ